MEKCKCEDRRIMDTFAPKWRKGYIHRKEPWNSTFPMKFCPWCRKLLPKAQRRMINV